MPEAVRKKQVRPKAKEINAEEITADVAFQLRYDVPSIDDYVQVLSEAGDDWPFPPLRVAKVGKTLFLVGGFTRLRAARHLGRKTVLAIVEPMTRAAAFQAALGENATHGYRRTRQDIRKAILAAQGKYPGWSLRQIAKVVGCSAEAVRRARQEIGADELPEEEATLADDLGPCPECKVSAWVETAKGTECGVCRLPFGAEVSLCDTPPPHDEDTAPAVDDKALASKDTQKVARLRLEAVSALRTDVGRIVRQVDALGALEGDLRVCLAKLKSLVGRIK